MLGMLCLFAMSFPTFAQANQIPFAKIQLTPRTTAVIKGYMVERRAGDEGSKKPYEMTIIDKKTLQKRTSGSAETKITAQTISYEYDLTWNSNQKDLKQDDFLIALWWNEQIVETFCFGLPEKGAGTYIKTFYGGSGDRMWCEFGDYAVIK
jgi:hypothetical protein